MSASDTNGRPAEPGSPEALPGHFVSDEHRSDCARFLVEVKNLVDRRREAGRDPRFRRSG